MQFPSGSLWEGQLIWTTWKPVSASVKFGLQSRGSFGRPGDPCYSAWAKVRGCPEELAPLRVADSERWPWFQRTHGRGTEDVLAVKDCCLFVNCSGSDVWVRLSGACSYGLMSRRCSHDLVDSTVSGHGDLSLNSHLVKRVCEGWTFCFLPRPSKCNVLGGGCHSIRTLLTLSPTLALN